MISCTRTAWGLAFGCMAWACGAPPGEGGPTGSGSTSGDGDGDGDGGSGASTGGDPGFELGSGGTVGAGGNVGADPCVVAGCGPGQRCEVVDGAASCIDRSCEELNCSDTEECRPHELGGNTCVTSVCQADVDCQATDYCSDAGACVPDVCEAGSTTCSDAGVTICASNGSGQETPYSCGSESNFESICVEGSGSAGCTCEDDWDCPAFTVCQVDHCVGTGFEPTCQLPPTDFNDTEPTVEIHWGTDAPGEDAHDGTGATPPWPNSTEVQATPLVANLDDDNGDGLINELDYPEIIFVSYTSGQVDNAGILRAIHGGGPNKGKDYFAVCANGDDPEFNITVWHEGDPLPAGSCNGDGRSRSPAAIGDLDYDGLPEIVQVTANHGIRILNNLGDPIISLTNDQAVRESGISLSPTIANLDNEGFAEVVFGGSIYTFERDAEGQLDVAARIDIPMGGMAGINGDSSDRGGPMTCVADLTSAPGQEILAGTTLYSFTGAALTPVWTATGISTSNGLCAVADVWGASSATPPGLDNPLDGKPEAVLIANDYLLILDGATGALVQEMKLNGGEGDQGGLGGPRGGAPNIDDFDGDGFPEVAVALADFYEVIDLQEPQAENCPEWPLAMPRVVAPGDNENPARSPGDVSCTENDQCNTGAVCNQQLAQCVCLHNGWRRGNDDSSSRLTSSSVFDFNGDGAAEVLYNDECEFRIYDGVSGDVHFSAVSRGRTWTENPTVADVDNDGNAEVVTFANTEPGDRCDEDGQTPMGPNGIRVWGDPNDTWVPARRIWNQQSYHVTNVTEGGAIPLNPPNSWESFNGRVYNTYRSQPRAFGVAPDLTVTGIGVFSPDAACGDLSDTINITYEITNAGDLRVGAGVELQFFGTWGGAEEVLLGEGGAPLTKTLSQGVDAGRSVIETVTFQLGNQTGKSDPPEAIRVEVDTAGEGDFGSERECDETNNDLSVPVEREQLADLSVLAGTAEVDCIPLVATVNVTVINSGTMAASGVVVHLYAGNPAQGGTRLAEHVLPDVIAPGAMVTVDLAAPNFPEDREVIIWALVDPSDSIDECNEADNTDPAENIVFCPVDVIR